jgi:hypothetical protein
MHSTQLGIGSGWRVARKPGKSDARRFASAYRTSHSFVVHIDSVLGVHVPPRNRSAVPDTNDQKNHVAACGAPGKWPDVDFGAPLQGPAMSEQLSSLVQYQTMQSSAASNPTKIAVGCFSYA